MSDRGILNFADKNQLENIHKELGEFDDRLKNRQELFKQWVQCENHMPKNIDQRLIDNFIRLSKFDIERAKSKFEMWLYARGQCRNLYCCPPLEDKKCSIHKHFLISKNLTEEGYRLILVRFKDIDVENFEVEHLLQYGFLYYEYFLFHDVNCGYVFILDTGDMSAQILAKIPIQLFKTGMDLITKVHPQRIRQIHVINLPTVAQGLFALGKQLLPLKLRKRVLTYNDTLSTVNYIKPTHILVDEFGGTSGGFVQLGEDARRFLLDKKDYIEERDTWILTGDLPTEKKKMYSFSEGNGVSGSFRKLQID